MRKSLSTLALIGAMSIVGSASADSIGINFDSGSGAIGARDAGVVVQGNWNDLENNNGSATDLMGDSGAGLVLMFLGHQKHLVLRFRANS